jgi:acyl carrier protein
MTKDSISNPDFEEILLWLTTNVAIEAKMNPDTVDIHAPFEFFGLDSIKSLTLSGLLEEWINRDLPPTLFWDYPNINSLAEFLAGTEQRTGTW